MIKEINITGLFDRYDYNITLHSSIGDSITFITGCNGMGKSTILRMINVLYQKDWDALLLYPFHTFQLVFETCAMTFNKNYEPIIEELKTEDLNFRRIDDYKLYVDYEEGGQLSSFDLGFYDANYHNTPNTIDMALMLDKPYFIDDQRLAFSYDELGNVTMPHRLDDCCIDCKRRLEELRTFANDKLSPFYSSLYNPEEYLVSNEELIAMYNKLIRWGVINAKPLTDETSSSSNINNVLSNMRLLYWEMKQSDSMNNTYVGLSEFESLIESYEFDHKVMKIHVNAGFRFKTTEELPLRLDQLSSGEKQVLLQSYELLLNASRGSIVLIDEPETSQHVAWQMDYCTNLQTIANARNLQCIVATHLPLMFNNEYSLSVDLYSLANPEEL